MKPPPGYERKLANIAAREDRHFVGRDHVDGTRLASTAPAGQRAACPQSQADRRPGSPGSPVIPAAPTVAGFSLSDRTRDDERQRRIAANWALEKVGLRPRLRW